jgi:heme A synthase
MTTSTPLSSANATRSQLWLQRIGAAGALLALLILAASILLRLATVFDAQGRSSSTLAPMVEHIVRLAHRLSASGVALLALWAVVLCWRCRRVAPQWARPTAWIVASTLILAVIGPLTSGYRLGAITVLNVSFGVLLLMSFWWLQEAALLGPNRPTPLDKFSWAALTALLLQMASGAGASAWEMQGLRWPAFVHLACVVFVLILTGVVLLDQYHKPRQRTRSFVVVGLLAAQVLVGYVLMAQDSRTLGLSLFHALLAPLLAAALVSLVKHGHSGFNQKHPNLDYGSLPKF